MGAGQHRGWDSYSVSRSVDVVGSSKYSRVVFFLIIKNLNKCPVVRITIRPRSPKRVPAVRVARTYVYFLIRKANLYQQP